MPADQRVPQPPKRPDSAALGKAGCDPAGWEHFKAQLVPCSRCSRTFFPHRLAIHERSCKGENKVGQGEKSTKKSDNSNKRDATNLKLATSERRKSLFLDCQACGRKFSTTSITLHEIKCRNNKGGKSLRAGSKLGEG